MTDDSARPSGVLTRKTAVDVDGGTVDLTDQNDIGDTEVIPREQLEKTADSEHGPCYRCPRCGFPYVTEHCDCPECLWAGMCQKGGSE